MITSHDVAKLAGVSQTTVSRAFRDDCYIHPETRKKVMDAANELGYFPNYSAKCLKKRQTKIIGLLLTNYNNKFYTTITQSIEQHMNDNGYRLMLTFSDENPGKERKYLESFISSRVDGLIYIPVSKSNEDLVRAAEQFDVKVLQFTQVMYDDLNSFFIDDEYGAYIATKYLLNLGHRRIMVIESEVNIHLSAKVKGYRKAFADAGVEVDEESILFMNPNCDNTSSLAYAIGDRKTTAIISSNSLFSVSVLKACRCMNLSIPEDISFISYDDNEWLDFMGIDTVAHPMNEIGTMVSEFLLELLNTPNEEMKERKPEFRTIKPHLIIRNSVKRI